MERRSYLEQARLAADPLFLARVQQALVDVAKRVLREHNIPHHKARAALALEALHEPERVTLLMARAVAGWHVNVAVDCDDLVLRNAVECLWDDFAGSREGGLPRRLRRAAGEAA